MHLGAHLGLFFGRTKLTDAGDRVGGVRSIFNWISTARKREVVFRKRVPFRRRQTTAALARIGLRRAILAILPHEVVTVRHIGLASGYGAARSPFQSRPCGPLLSAPLPPSSGPGRGFS